MVRFKSPDKFGSEYLTPSAIREKFGYHEQSTWAHLWEGKWAAIGFAEFVTEAGKRCPIEDTYLPPELIRQIFSGLYEGEVRDFHWGDSIIRLRYSKDSVMVLCSPDATPELFPEHQPNHSTSSPDNELQPLGPVCTSQELIDAFDLDATTWRDRFSHIKTSGRKYKQAQVHAGKRGRGQSQARWHPVIFAKLLVQHDEMAAARVKHLFNKEWPQYEYELLAELDDIT